MKRWVCILGALAVVGTGAGIALAQGGYQEIYGPVYGNQVNVFVGRQGWAPGYGVPGGAWGYGGPQIRTPSYGYDAHSAAVRRIMAEHSRSRYYTHPRSLYNGPPVYGGYYGWGYGY